MLAVYDKEEFNFVLSFHVKNLLGESVPQQCRLNLFISHPRLFLFMESMLMVMPFSIWLFILRRVVIVLNAHGWDLNITNTNDENIICATSLNA